VKKHYSKLLGDSVDVLVADISKFHAGGGLGISLEGTQNLLGNGNFSSMLHFAVHLELLTSENIPGSNAMCGFFFKLALFFSSKKIWRSSARLNHSVMKLTLGK